LIISDYPLGIEKEQPERIGLHFSNYLIKYCEINKIILDDEQKDSIKDWMIGSLP
jgi:hypothetical protein